MSREGLRRRIIFTGYIVIFVFAVFILRLWQLQVLEGKRNRLLTERNKIKVLNVAAPRGIIYDRNGKALVKNTPFFIASLIPGAVEDVDIRLLASLLNMDEDDVRDKLSAEVPPFEAIKLKEGIPFEEVAYIEARRSDVPGLIIETEITRHYEYGTLAAHVVGYLGMPGPEKLKRFRKSDIPPDAFFGTWGIEKLHDEHLRGTPGKRLIEVDALGRQLKIISEDPPLKGDDLMISLDIGLQQTIEDAFAGRTGAAVALDPATSEILALVSLPSFDPNLFSRGISAADWIALNENPYHPFLNRALQSQYPPGSVFKIVVATAALEENILPKDFKVNCRGRIRHGRWEYRCWKRSGHGIVDLHRAIAESCDIFFYEVGKLLGIDTIADYAKRFGLGMSAGMKLVEEKEGFIPTTAWKKEQLKEPWYIGETYHASIGQGYVLTTPLQQALLIDAIAHDGIVLMPSITKGSGEGEVLRRILLRKDTLRTIQEALRGVVNEKHGTAYWGARSKQFMISGKTGTSQVVRERKMQKEEDIPERFRDHAWFVAFAPHEKPRIAMSVFVEHGGHGASAAAPIAKKGIEHYLSKLDVEEESKESSGEPN